MNKKLEQIKKTLSSLNLAGIFITNKLNRRYLCGFTGSNGLLLITEKKDYLFIDGRYTEQARQQTNDVEIIVASVGQSIYELPLQIIEANQLYGFEAATIDYQTYQTLSQIVAQLDSQLSATENLVEQLRAIKTPDEMEKMKAATAIADKTLTEILPLIQAGMTERELATEIDYRSKKLGSENPAFETIVASGKRTALPHAHASDKLIQKNELIMIDFGTIVDGYYSDVTRTFAFGEVSAEIKKAYQQLLHVQKATIAAIKIGQKLSDIDDFARKSLGKYQLADYFSHNLGHSIGLDCHEVPTLSPKDTTVLEKMMVFTIEPGIYLPNQFGIRIEDDVYVDARGEVVCLTNFTKEWTEL